MRKSFIFDYIKSYMVVLSVAIVLMTVVNFIYIRVMENDTIQKNGILLEHIKTTFDLRFTDISNLSFQIEKNEHNQRLMNSSNPDKMDIYKLIKDLSICRITNHIVEDIYIYYPVHNIVVTDTGVFTLRGFYKLNCKYDENKYLDFKQMLMTRHFREFRASNDIGLNGSSKVNLNYYHSFPSGVQNPVVGILGVKISNAKMAEDIDNIALGNAEYFAVTDDSNNLISYSGNQELEAFISGMNFPVNVKTSVRTENSMVISNIHSSFNNINYISICGKNIMLKTINTLQNLLLVCLVLIFLIELPITYYFSKRNEKPILTMTKTLEGVSDKLVKQALLLKNIFLTRLVKGEIKDKNTFLQLTTNYSIDISKETFAVLLVYIDSAPDNYMQNALQGEASSEAGSLEAVIKRVIRDNFETQTEINVFDLDGITTVLLTSNIREDQMELFSNCISNAADGLSRDYNINARIAAGSMYKCYNQITMSYYEAVHALERLLEDNKEKFICYSAVKNQQSKGRVENLDLLSMFINCIKLQDYSNALAITEQLFSNYLNPAMPYEVYSVRKNAIVAIILDMVEQISIQDKDGDFQYHNCHSMLAAAANQQEKLKEAVCSVINMANEYKQKAEASDYKKYINTLKDYIDKNYTNPDLGLYMIADTFGINESYLSKMFKKEFNIGLLNYINKVRIEKSKNLLAVKTLNIAQISKDVGYISDITFIRVFKRYEGTTPGRYRELISQI